MNIETATAAKALDTALSNHAAAVSAVDADSPLVALLSIRWAKDDLERAQTQMVIAARAKGFSWAIIAKQLNTSPQAAHQRYRDHA